MLIPDAAETAPVREALLHPRSRRSSDRSGADHGPRRGLVARSLAIGTPAEQSSECRDHRPCSGAQDCYVSLAGPDGTPGTSRPGMPRRRRRRSTWAPGLAERDLDGGQLSMTLGAHTRSARKPASDEQGDDGHPGPGAATCWAGDVIQPFPIFSEICVARPEGPPDQDHSRAPASPGRIAVTGTTVGTGPARERQPFACAAAQHLQGAALIAVYRSASLPRPRMPPSST